MEFFTGSEGVEDTRRPVVCTEECFTLAYCTAVSPQVMAPNRFLVSKTDIDI